MKAKRIYLYIFTLVLLAMGAVAQGRTLIYSDSFNRRGPLNGSAPGIGGSAPAWAKQAKWIAAENMNTTGNMLVIPEVPPSGVSVSANAYLPAEIRTNSGIFTIKTTCAAVWGDFDSWVAIGFAINTAGVGDGFFSNSLGMTTYSRGNDDWKGPSAVVSYLNGPYNPERIEAVNKAGALPLTITLTLNTYKVANNLTITIEGCSTEKGGKSVRKITRTLPPSLIDSIHAIKIGAFEGQGGTFENFQFFMETKKEN